tara:strand:+ start:398 stop:538 length:141 start_codon:yes stop_codon:yes gene_type:complete
MKELQRSPGAYYRTKLGINLIKPANAIELNVKPKTKKKKSTKTKKK